MQGEAERKPTGSQVRLGDDPQRELRIRAAWIYYIEGRTQNEVAQTLGLNRVAVTRLLSEARNRGEVDIRVRSDLADIVSIERRLEKRFRLSEAVVAPFSDPGGDPTRVIAAAAGRYISRVVSNDMIIGVGWGRTLHATLGFLSGKPLKNARVVSLLGGITEAKRFNPAEFAWQFAELFDAEGFLVPAPALVDSPRTKHALLENCGLDQVFQLAEAADIAFVSCGGISTITTSYRLGHLSESERSSLEEAGAVGDVLYNFIDASGTVVPHSVNERNVSISMERLRRIRKTVLISGGAEKIAVLRATMQALRPGVLITDEQSALALLEDGAA